MRRYGIEQPYEQLKALTVASGWSAKPAAFVADLAIPDEARRRLLAMTPRAIPATPPFRRARCKTTMLPQVLGDLSPARFLAEYWRKKPLLVRGPGRDSAIH